MKSNSSACKSCACWSFPGQISLSQSQLILLTGDQKTWFWKRTFPHSLKILFDINLPIPSAHFPDPVKVNGFLFNYFKELLSKKPGSIHKYHKTANVKSLFFLTKDVIYREKIACKAPSLAYDLHIHITLTHGGGWV